MWLYCVKFACFLFHTSFTFTLVTIFESFFNKSARLRLVKLQRNNCQYNATLYYNIASDKPYNLCHF